MSKPSEFGSLAKQPRSKSPYAEPMEQAALELIQCEVIRHCHRTVPDAMVSAMLELTPEELVNIQTMIASRGD